MEYKTHIRRVKAKSGKVYEYISLSPIIKRETKGIRKISKSGRRYIYYYQKSNTHGNTKLDGVFSYKIKELIKRKDKVCQICGSSKNLDVHHIDGNGYPKSKTPNQNQDNLILLCHACHINLHLGKVKNRATLIEGILYRRERGETFASIGEYYGMSRQRIHQIYKEELLPLLR